MGARRQAQGDVKKVKRAGLQVITERITAKKAELQVYVQRAWGDSQRALESEVLGLTDRRDFYHGKLLLKALELERVEFMRSSAADEYVHYLGKAMGDR